jgi:hypothetical protein
MFTIITLALIGVVGSAVAEVARRVMDSESK